MITFNKPFFIGNEIKYIRDAVRRQQLSGNGLFTRKCHDFFEKRLGFGKSFLTTSGTAALEMAALLADIHPGDEVIMPSFTFVSCANAFVLRGARIIFADSGPLTPHVDPESVQSLITPRTKAILVMHYGGVACDMDAFKAMAERHKLWLIEDAAHAIGASYRGAPIGTLGHFAAFSFHETKNIICGEGGLLVVNAPRFRRRAELIWEKGTNRAAYARGEVSKYEWMDVGSSFLPSELNAAYLFAQLERMKLIQNKRLKLWRTYESELRPLEKKGILSLPMIPDYAQPNGHLFYLLCKSKIQRDSLIAYLKRRRIHAVFHYLPLHQSPFYRKQHNGRILLNAVRYANCLVRLPMYYGLSLREAKGVAVEVKCCFNQ